MNEEQHSFYIDAYRHIYDDMLSECYREDGASDKCIAIIDADLIGRKRHRFPNLVCLKLSGYWKEKGADVILKTDYEDLDIYDKVYISKVFTDTPIDENILTLPNVEYGGTGFFYDKAPNLPYEIEHHMPDYHLYDVWVKEQIEAGGKRIEFKGYLDYSIGYITRGCFRKCEFCVNKKYDKAFLASHLEEFLDPSRPKICLLDDNFLSHPKWKDLLRGLMDTGKPFKFKQGLDERLLTDEKVEMLCHAKYDGQIIFAFDSVKDYDLIETQLKRIRKYTDKIFTFYVLVGFESQDVRDIENAFIRICLLMKYRCLPYIMRYEKYKESPYRGIYVTLARWCNQPSMFKKTSLRQYADADLRCGQKSTQRYITEFEKDHPEIAARYFDMKWGDTE